MIRCELWTYWGEPQPMETRYAEFPIPPLEGDDVWVDGKLYDVIKRRIEAGKPLRLYLAGHDEYNPDLKEAAE